MKWRTRGAATICPLVIAAGFGIGTPCWGDPFDSGAHSIQAQYPKNPPPPSSPPPSCETLPEQTLKDFKSVVITKGPQSLDPTPNPPGTVDPVVVQPPNSQPSTGIINPPVPKPPQIPFPPSDLGSIQNSIDLSERARGLELVNAAIDRRREIESFAATDYESLNDRYKGKTAADLLPSLKRAATNLDSQITKLQNVESGLQPDETARFTNFLRNARDKSEAGAALLEDQLSAQGAKSQVLQSPLNLFDLASSKLSDAVKNNPVVQDLASLFGSAATAGTYGRNTDEELVNRYVMYNGLSPKDAAELQKSLGLIVFPKVKNADGSTEDLPLLHNGYILGANSKTATDCSSFMSFILGNRARQSRLTTLDFLQIWRLQRLGKFPKPPTYERSREQLVRQIAPSFQALDIYQGDLLIPGDLLFYRDINKPAGHIVMVKKYQPATEDLTMIDASQSAGTIREKTIKMGYKDPKTGKRMLRAGLVALRISANDSRACKYKK